MNPTINENLRVAVVFCTQAYVFFLPLFEMWKNVFGGLALVFGFVMFLYSKSGPELNTKLNADSGFGKYYLALSLALSLSPLLVVFGEVTIEPLAVVSNTSQHLIYVLVPTLFFFIFIVSAFDAIT